jgi:hypothetical protein
VESALSTYSRGGPHRRRNHGATLPEQVSEGEKRRREKLDRSSSFSGDRLAFHRNCRQTASTNETLVEARLWRKEVVSSKSVDLFETGRWHARVWSGSPLFFLKHALDHKSRVDRFGTPHSAETEEILATSAIRWQVGSRTKCDP